MSTKEKLIKRFCSLPKDFTFQELCSFMKTLGFELGNKGNTSGSAVEFYSNELDVSVIIHKPHPGDIMKQYALKKIKLFLEKEGLL